MKDIEQDLNRVKLELLKDFNDPFINSQLANFISKNSKFIRSRFTLLYLKTNNINITDSIIKILAVGEIIHNASLLHDDVIDNANYRRGQETFAKIFTPKISILAGDYLLSYAIEKLLSLNNFVIVNILKNCTKEMAKAEIEQFLLRNKETSLEEYLNICKGKTANLFSAILESCYSLLKLDIQIAKSFAEKFGIYFQLKNDMNEISAQNDKENGVKTIQDILGVEKAKGLLDNYKEEMSLLLSELPDNNYKKGLEDLIKSV